MKGFLVLKTIIDLDNNYYLKIVDNAENFPINIIKLENLNLINIIKKKSFLFLTDFNKLNKKEYKRVLKKLLFIKKIVLKSKIKIGKVEDSRILLGYIINYDENNRYQNDFILAINAIFYNTRYERYNYIYDTVCDYLDSYFYGKNLCDFKTDEKFLKLFGGLTQKSKRLGDVLCENPDARHIYIVIGPEGDFSSREYEYMRNNGFLECKLTNNILRSESAALYALSIVDHFYKC